MKLSIFILCLFSLLSKFYSQEIVKVQLIDYTKNKMPPYCGYSKQYGLLKLILLEKSKKLKSGDTLFIYQMCPRELMEEYVGEYKNDKIYKLNLGKKIKKNKFRDIKDFSFTRYRNTTNNNFYYGLLEK